MKRALERRLPLVLDGDGLFLVTRLPEILLGDASAKRRVVMTPNVNEFRRLQDALGMVEPGAHLHSACPLDDSCLCLVQRPETWMPPQRRWHPCRARLG